MAGSLARVRLDEPFGDSLALCPRYRSRRKRGSLLDVPDGRWLSNWHPQPRELTGLHTDAELL